MNLVEKETSNQTAYIIESNNEIKEVEILSSDNDFVTVRYGYVEPHYIPGGKHHLTAKGGLRVRKSRVYLSLLDAQLAIKAKEDKEKQIELDRVFDKFK